MDTTEARLILEKELARYRSRSYDELVATVGNADVLERTGASGTEYQLEIVSFSDHGAIGDIHVIASIDDGSFWHSFRPVTGDFIVRPDGSFVGE